MKKKGGNEEYADNGNPENASYRSARARPTQVGCQDHGQAGRPRQMIPLPLPGSAHAVSSYASCRLIMRRTISSGIVPNTPNDISTNCQ